MTTGLIGFKPTQGEKKRQRKRPPVLKARTKNIPRFNLRDTKGSEAKIVYLRYRYEKGVYPIVLATGVKVSPQYWNAKDGRARRVAALPEATDINKFLSDLENKTVQSAIKLLAEHGKIDRDKLVSEIKKHLGKKIATSFIEFAKDRSEKSGNQDEKRLVTLWPQYDKKGNLHFDWYCPSGRRNEAWDLEVLSLVGIRVLQQQYGLDLDVLSAQNIPNAPAPVQVRRRRQISGGVD